MPTPEEKYAWVVNTLLVERLNFGFDFVLQDPVPQWFFDDVAQAWAARDGEPIEEYAWALRAEGLVVE